jgi:hypothetical protein
MHQRINLEPRQQQNPNITVYFNPSRDQQIMSLVNLCGQIGRTPVPNRWSISALPPVPHVRARAMWNISKRVHNVFAYLPVPVTRNGLILNVILASLQYQSPRSLTEYSNNQPLDARSRSHFPRESHAC